MIKQFINGKSEEIVEKTKKILDTKNQPKKKNFKICLDIIIYLVNEFQNKL